MRPRKWPSGSGTIYRQDYYYYDDEKIPGDLWTGPTQSPRPVNNCFIIHSKYTIYKYFTTFALKIDLNF